MALVFVDGCDCYAATADLIKRWSLNSNTTNITYDATGGKQGTGAIKMVTSGVPRPRHHSRQHQDPHGVLAQGQRRAEFGQPVYRLL